MGMKLRGSQTTCLVAGLALFTSACASGASPGRPVTSVASKPFVSARAPDTFVAVRGLPGPGGSQAVTISDATTGQIQHLVLPDPWHGMQVNSTAVDSAGGIWVTLASGPRCTSNIAGCGPVPDSCAGEVVRIDPTTGSLAPVLKASGRELIGDAEPSPNGKLVAYLDGSCNRSYFSQHLQVRDIATGQSWSIGSGLTVCHSLGSLAWATGGSHLVVYYGPSTLVPGNTGSYGYGPCQQPDPNQLAVVPALQPAAGLPGARVPMDPNCQAEAVTATKGGYAAIEACGPSHNYLSGSASLVLIDSKLHVTSRSQIGECVDGAELRADSSGSDLLGSSYQFCNPPGTSPPRTVTFTDTGSGPQNVIDVRNGGTNSVVSISW
jgi:hypothetical protein